MRSCWFTSMCNTVYDSSQCDSHLLQRQSVSLEKTGWKYNPAPRRVPLPEPCIRCQDSSVQLELSSPLKASTWQEPVVSAVGWNLPKPTGQMPFGSPTLPQLHVAALLHPRPLAGESSPQAAGRRGKAGGNPHSLGPQAHCKGNKKLVSFPVLAQQKHHPLPAQESLNTEKRQIPLELMGKEQAVTARHTMAMEG